MAAEGCGWGRKAAEGAGTRVLFLEEAPRETLLVHRLTPTRRGRRLPMGAEGAGTLIRFFEEAPPETIFFDRLTPTPKGPMGTEGCPTLAPFSLKTNENQ